MTDKQKLRECARYIGSAGYPNGSAINELAVGALFLLDENERLREALRFYASRTVRSSAGEDLGKRAREVLGE